MTHPQPPSDAVKRLIACPSPLALLELMTSDRALRKPSCAEELRGYAVAVQPHNAPLAGQIEVVAAEMEAIFQCIDNAPGDGTLATHNAWVATHGHAWVGATKRLILAAAADARHAGDFVTRRRLVAALLAQRRLERVVSWVGENVKAADFLEQLERKELPLDDFVEWLRIRGQVPDEHAPRFLWLREYITTLKRISSPKFTPSAKPGWVQWTLPVTDGVAHAWFVRDPEFYESCKARVATLKNEDWPKTLDELVTQFFDDSDWEQYAQFIEERGGSGEQGARVHATTVVCEVALMHGPAALSEAALATYNSTVTSADCVAQPRAAWETHVYHYVYALVRYWARARDPRARLEAGIKLAEEAIVGSDVTRAPRLMRDMHFACARLYERLGEWDRACFEQAITHYTQGLDVEALKSERDPRARALADLANVLHRSGKGMQAEIEGLYKEALQLRPVDESSLAAASGRLNYGIFLFEQVGTTVAKARALELLNEAEAAFPGMDPEVREAPWGKELFASILMTRANILREEGSAAAVRESLELYDRAVRFLGDDDWFRPIKAMLSLNCCFAHLDLHDLTEKESALVAADMAAEEAAALAVDSAAIAEAKLCKALVGLRAGEPAASLLQAIDECSRVIRSAGGRVRALSALAWRARVGVASGDATAVLESRELFREGMETARNAGLYFEYLQHTRGFAHASVVAWRASSDASHLLEAVDALEEVRTAIEAQLTMDVLLVDGDGAHAHLAAVAAELAWLRAALGDGIDRVLADATLAKGPDSKVEFLVRTLAASLSANTAAELSVLRKGDWSVRRDVVQRERVDPRLTSDVSTLKSAEERRALAVGHFRRDLLKHPVLEDEVRPDVGLIIDITVCRWGSVVLAIPEVGAPARVISAPFTLSMFQELQQTWLDEYVDSGGPPRYETEKFIETIERELFDGASDLLEAATRVVFVPHVLAGVPLHATRLPTGVPLSESAGCIAYAANVLAVRKMPLEVEWATKRVLCLALDPGGSDELVNACAEVADAAKTFVDCGADVTVVAESGGKQGPDAFALRGVGLDARVKCENPSAVASWITENLRTFDHVLVASHGAYGATGGNIILPTGTISVLDLLATTEVKAGATIHLSACETAMRVGPIFSLVSGFFHLGAGFVLGTCWRVRDRDALTFSHAFYRDVTNGSRRFEEAATLAVRELRKQLGDAAVERWSSFISVLG